MDTANNHQEPQVSILICSRDRRSDLELLVKSLQAMNTTYTYEIVVVEETDMPENISGVSYVSHPRKNLGIPYARNLALENAMGEFLVFLDDDCIVTEKWLDKLLLPFEMEEVVGVQGGVMVPDDSNAVGWAETIIGFPGGGLRRIINSKGHDQETVEVSTLNCAYRKSVSEKIGGFDSELRLGGEDYFFAKEAAKHGKLMYVPSALVQHLARGSFSLIWGWFVRRGLAEIKLLKLGKKTKTTYGTVLRGAFLVKLIPVFMVLFFSVQAFVLLSVGFFAFYYSLQYYRLFDIWQKSESSTLTLILCPVVKLTMDIATDWGRIKGVIKRERCKEKRILAISNHANMLGGGEHSFLECISRLPDHWKIIAATPDEGELNDRLKEKGLKTCILPLPSIRPKLLFPILSAIKIFIKTCNRFQPGIIYANGSRAALYGSIIGKILGIPVVWHCRVPEHDKYLDSFLSLLCEKVVVNSKATASRFNSIRPEKVITVYNGLDLNWLTNKECTTPDEIEDDWKVIVKVARVSRWKRHDVVLEAFLQIAADDPSVHLVCLGARDELEVDWWNELQEKTKNSPYADRIHWLGQIDDVRPWFQNAYMMLLGSENEAFGRIVVEAMASGVPLVATRSGGVPEIVRDGVDGFLVTPGNAREMAEAAIKILSDEELHQQMILSGGERAREFSLETHVSNMDKLFANILDT